MRPEEGFEYAHLVLIRSVGTDQSCIIAHLSRTVVPNYIRCMSLLSMVLIVVVIVDVVFVVVIAVVVVVVVCCCCSSFLLLNIVADFAAAGGFTF